MNSFHSSFLTCDGDNAFKANTGCVNNLQWLFQCMSMLWLLLEAAFCCIQEQKDSCSLLTAGLLWIITCSWTSFPMDIKLDTSWYKKIFVWVLTVAIMGKVCVQFEVSLFDMLWLYWQDDSFCSIRSSSMRTETLEAITMSAWTTVLTCTQCLTTAAPYAWRAACSWSTTDRVSWGTSTSWERESIPTTWAWPAWMTVSGHASWSPL